MPPNFEPKFGFSRNDSFFETVFSLNAPTFAWKCEPYTRIHLIGLLEYPSGYVIDERITR